MSDSVAAVPDELIEALFKKFVIKVRQERTARLAGRIAEADFYLRQISFFEVALELGSEDAFQALAELRRGEFGVTDIAQTAGTAILDRLRVESWLELELGRRRRSSPLAGEGGARSELAPEEEEGEQDDPLALDLFPPHLLSDQPASTRGGELWTEPLPDYHLNHPAEGHSPDRWAELDRAERGRAYVEQYARAAAAEQVKWEQEMLTRALDMKVKLAHTDARPPAERAASEVAGQGDRRA